MEVGVCSLIGTHCIVTEELSALTAHNTARQRGTAEETAPFAHTAPHISDHIPYLCGISLLNIHIWLQAVRPLTAVRV